jgi:hypothetical protein
VDSQGDMLDNIEVHVIELALLNHDPSMHFFFESDCEVIILSSTFFFFFF